MMAGKKSVLVAARWVEGKRGGKRKDGRGGGERTHVCHCARTVRDGERHGFGASVIIAILHEDRCSATDRCEGRDDGCAWIWPQRAGCEGGVLGEACAG